MNHSYRDWILSAMALLLVSVGTWSLAAAGNTAPRRIISLAPSITETLFALGAGSQVVGATQHCIYPAEAKKLPRVEGYYDPSLESMIRLRPDLVILPPEIYETGRQLGRLHVPVLVVNQRSMAGVVSSFVQLGQVAGCEAQGGHMAAELWQACQAARASRARGARPRVLLVLSRDYGVRQLREAYVAGRGAVR